MSKHKPKKRVPPRVTYRANHHTSIANSPIASARINTVNGILPFDGEINGERTITSRLLSMHLALVHRATYIGANRSGPQRQAPKAITAPTAANYMNFNPVPKRPNAR